MFLYEIKEYLNQSRLEFNENIEDDLQKLKEKAIARVNEQQANEIWCLQEVNKIKKKYISMYNQIKKVKNLEGWRLLDDIDINFCMLRENFDYSNNLYNLQFIEQIIKYYKKVFPEYIFTSRESIIKEEKCSICGKITSLRNGCGHKIGKLYMGELCLREVTDYEFIGVAIVKKPFDNYAVMEIEGLEYNYSILQKLMVELDSPYIPWYVEQMKKRKPEYMHIGRNDKCPCGSGKKYKVCCRETENEYMLHIRITILGEKKIKETPIEYSGRLFKKKKNEINGKRATS